MEKINIIGMHGYTTDRMPNEIRVAPTQRPVDSPMVGGAQPTSRVVSRQRAKWFRSAKTEYLQSRDRGKGATPQPNM